MKKRVTVRRRTCERSVATKEHLDKDGYFVCDGCRFANWRGDAQVSCSGNAKVCPHKIVICSTKGL